MPSIEELKTWSVLIVDDEPDNLAVIADTLTFFGLRVQRALTADKALELLTQKPPRLILLDLSMPEIDGWTFLRRLKTDECWREILVVALSAHAMVGDRERAIAAGFDGYITKPVNVPTLLRDICKEIRD